MSLNITHFRVIKNGSIEKVEKHLLNEEETQEMKAHFEKYIVPMSDFVDEWGYKQTNMSYILVKTKITINYGIRNLPLIPSNHYLFTKEEINQYAQEGLRQEDYRTKLYHEEILNKFKEGKDFLHFDN